MKRNRAYIRATKVKAKLKAKRLAKVVRTNPVLAEDEDWINNMASTHCVPINDSCNQFGRPGDPRKIYNEVTFAEMKFEDDVKEQIKELVNEA